MENKISLEDIKSLEAIQKVRGNVSSKIKTLIGLATEMQSETSIEAMGLAIQSGVHKHMEDLVEYESFILEITTAGIILAKRLQVIQDMLESIDRHQYPNQ